MILTNDRHENGVVRAYEVVFRTSGGAVAETPEEHTARYPTCHASQEIASPEKSAGVASLLKELLPHVPNTE